MGVPAPELVHYNPKDFDFGKAKAFPMRDQHFFTSVDKVGGVGDAGVGVGGVLSHLRSLGRTFDFLDSGQRSRIFSNAAAGRAPCCRPWPTSTGSPSLA